MLLVCARYAAAQDTMLGEGSRLHVLNESLEGLKTGMFSHHKEEFK
jgi:hypothetical protein